MAEKKLVIAPGAWTERDEELLAPAMRADPGAAVDGLRELVDAGKGYLFHVLTESGELVASIVLRIDERHECAKFGAYRDGVIVAAGTSARWVWRHVPALLADLERRFVGVRRIRIHTASRALLKALSREGYKFQEWVIWKSVPA